MRFDLLAFDAYGTLFDVYSVTSLCESLFPGRGSSLAQLLRAKQLQYSLLRSMMGRYQDFWRVPASRQPATCPGQHDWLRVLESLGCQRRRVGGPDRAVDSTCGVRPARGARIRCRADPPIDRRSRRLRSAVSYGTNDQPER